MISSDSLPVCVRFKAKKEPKSLPRLQALFQCNLWLCSVSVQQVSQFSRSCNKSVKWVLTTYLSLPQPVFKQFVLVMYFSGHVVFIIILLQLFVNWLFNVWTAIGLTSSYCIGQLDATLHSSSLYIIRNFLACHALCTYLDGVRDHSEDKLI